jgi:hypothetical protein
MTRRRRRIPRIPPERIPLTAFLMLLGIGGLWLRSYERADLLAFFTPSGKLEGLASHDGKVMLFFSNLPFRPERGLSVDYDNTPADVFAEVTRLLADQTPGVRGGLGFHYARSNVGAFGMAGKSFTFLTIPHWLAMLLILVPSFLRARRRRRSARWASAGRCGGCGYDLRAAPAGGATVVVRCPECGEQAAAPAPDAV